MPKNHYKNLFYSINQGWGTVISAVVSAVACAVAVIEHNCKCDILPSHNCNCECISCQANNCNCKCWVSARHNCKYNYKWWFKAATTATASTNGNFRLGTTASTTANNGSRQPQLQLQSQLHTPASKLHTTACNCQFQTSQTIESSIFCYIWSSWGLFYSIHISLPNYFLLHSMPSACQFVNWVCLMD